MKKFWKTLWPGKIDAELDEELRFHIEERVEENIAAGMLPEEAQRDAQRRFGNATALKESTRDANILVWLESLIQDVRYALRGFMQTPAFALTVVGTIGLALGLNTALFTLFNAYVLRPFPVHDPHSLYQFTWITKDHQYHRFTAREFEDVRRTNPVFSDALTSYGVVTRVGGQQGMTEVISDNAFSMLGAQAAIGRGLLPGDEGVLVMSDATWKNKFGSDPAILGKKVELLGASYEIIGVMPRQFTALRQAPPDFWIPLIRIGPQALEKGWFIGRLRPGMAPDQAKAALTVWAQQKTADLPAEQRAKSIEFESSATPVALKPEVVAMITPVVIAFGLVLLIACANVANMMLARAMARQREIGVRLSLGAGRFRLIRQLLTESLLLGVPAALAGVLISQWAIHGTEALVMRTVPSVYTQVIRPIPIDLDFRVFLFVFAAAVASTLVFGLVPAFQATKPGVMHATRGDFSADIRPSRLRAVLVVCQVTVCVLLLICSGVLLREGMKLTVSDVRLTVEGAFDVRFEKADQAKLAERLREQPLVEAVAATSRAPLYGSGDTIPVSTGGRKATVRVVDSFVGPEYFDVFRIPLVRGRNFTEAEARSEAAVAIVSEKTAALLWPGQDALGQSIRTDPMQRGMKTSSFNAAIVVGIAPDVMSGFVTDGLDPSHVYFPTSPAGVNNRSLLVRVHGDPDVARVAIDRALASVTSAGSSIVMPMDQALAIQIYPFRAGALVASALGGLALALSLSGIYGVLSYLVSQRTKEIGIRMALGASNANVVRIVLSQSMRLALVGILIGAGLALGVSRWAASELQNVDTFDALAYLGSIAVALVAALVAAYVPSRRAAAVDPVNALRCD